MAELEIKQNNSGKCTKQKKLSTRVDLTPMVDLGFLLITFFIFTTSITKPVAMKMFLPTNDNSNLTTIAKSKVINLIAVANNKVKYYYGDDVYNMQETNFSKDGLRKILLDKKKNVEQKFGNAKEMIVLIKPSSVCNYENVVNLFDEMIINDISRYMLLDVSETEKNIAKI